MPLNAEQEFVITYTYQVETQIAGELEEEDKNGQRPGDMYSMEKRIEKKDSMGNDQPEEDKEDGDNFWEFVGNIVRFKCNYDAVLTGLIPFCRNRDCRLARLQMKRRTKSLRFKERAKVRQH